MGKGEPGIERSVHSGASVYKAKSNIEVHFVEDVDTDEIDECLRFHSVLRYPGVHHVMAEDAFFGVHNPSLILYVGIFNT